MAWPTMRALFCYSLACTNLPAVRSTWNSHTRCWVLLLLLLLPRVPRAVAAPTGCCCCCRRLRNGWQAVTRTPNRSGKASGRPSKCIVPSMQVGTGVGKTQWHSASLVQQRTGSSTTHLCFVTWPATCTAGLVASQTFASAAAADRECYHHPHGLLQLAFVSTHGAAATRYSTAKKVSRWR